MASDRADRPDRRRRRTPASDDELTIEQLSERTGLTARNIRAYRTQRLLPPPVVRNGVGFYGAEHVARIERIRQLRAEGFNLTAIGRLLDDGDTAASPELRDLRRVVSGASGAEPPRTVEPDELLRLLGDQLTPALVQRATELGAVRALPDGRLELPTPALLDAAAELTDRGIPLEPVMPVFELVQRECETIADAFLDTFHERVWSHFQEAGHPRARWDEIAETIERLRPMASKAVLAIFQSTIDDAIERRFGDELAQLAERG
ncbi:MerR family transcriptional regulator [Conexibacter stalactiti]|uniref:MerR family transcriptional regulator n=1 Tax=Conexibacter stalactiti TaxID=1940611 RepID=A0ABU4HZZ5_9ACTN|nr:MerR family transcriptional regulator [Conexibacter stalactiti]MDW5598785.1 MerR family transcriptional regulator [Conexibacter stalactiti]MEC5039427.1 MerR family transcriptional regulator [Conexibacter stalactiti]